MSFVPEHLQARLKELVEPTDGEVLRAKRAVLERLARGPADQYELSFILVDEEGIPRQLAYDSHLEIPVTRDQTHEADLDAHDPHLARARLTLAVRVAISELAAGGLLQGVSSPDGGFTAIPVRYGNQSGSVQIPVVSPTLWPTPMDWRGISGTIWCGSWTATCSRPQLDGLELDERAVLCVREALEAFRRGLYLSCVSLLGAVSEGAWWRRADSLRGRSEALDRALDDDRTSAATLIRLTADEIARMKGLKNVAAELHAHATYLRELRNYGIHTRAADPEASQEHAFTEAGCALLLLSTHRYLERLARVREAEGG